VEEFSDINLNGTSPEIQREILMLASIALIDFSVMLRVMLRSNMEVN